MAETKRKPQSQHNQQPNSEFIQSFQQKRKIEKKIRKEQKEIWGGRMNS